MQACSSKAAHFPPTFIVRDTHLPTVLSEPMHPWHWAHALAHMHSIRRAALPPRTWGRTPRGNGRSAAACRRPGLQHISLPIGQTLADGRFVLGFEVFHEVHGTEALVGADEHVRPCRRQHLHHRQGRGLHRPVQGGVPLKVLRVHLGAAVKEEGTEVGVVHGGGGVQGRVPVPVNGVDELRSGARGGEAAGRGACARQPVGHSRPKKCPACAAQAPARLKRRRR